MELHGQNILGASRSGLGKTVLRAVNPATGEKLEPRFHEATPDEIDEALTLAAEAFRSNRRLSAEKRAQLLDVIAGHIEAIGDQLVGRVCAETALPEGRVKGERQRTISQLRMFAELVREGSWVDARIDRALPGRQPVAKPDLRRMLTGLGPVAVFGASNFPLAFSVAGGDTASALAAGCPVVVKAHPAHPGTSELVGMAIQQAVAQCAFHPGTFSLLHSQDPEISIALVTHPATCAVGFTGSYRAGRAIFDAASSRSKPIPVYAEMGSVNPVFLLPGALSERLVQISEGLVQSVSLGVGQFCTNPGLVFGVRSSLLDRFIDETKHRVEQVPCGTMLTPGIKAAYQKGLARLQAAERVKLTASSPLDRPGGVNQAGSAFLLTDDNGFLANPWLAEEVFGPCSLLVACASDKRMEEIASSLEGNLTATIHGTEQDLSNHRDLIHVLEEKVGRLIFNGFPTGVEVCPAMHHGGPFPATTDPKFTSVGTAAIYRFARPVCYQNFPQSALPEELQDHNPRRIWRQIDGQLRREG
ncbi:MAG: aldehyde dehydrogenase (NADP(+)) [Acidobacteria bacterium]|nr:MAG: aldehyde dehydrogenase (NADP(+)) [Acidobacteriota bacterium]